MGQAAEDLQVRQRVIVSLWSYRRTSMLRCDDSSKVTPRIAFGIAHVLITYLSVQEHLPYADDSNAVTPMSEENGAMVVPIYYANLGSRHSSYSSHASRMSYTSHGDLLGGLGGNRKGRTKESQLRDRNRVLRCSQRGLSITEQPTSKLRREYVSIRVVSEVPL